MDSTDWDERYASADLVWSSTPNQWVAELAGPLTPGRALDVAAGEGRNAIWLVERGWTVTATDYSPVAVERMRRIADERLGDRASALTVHVADATQGTPAGSAAYDLVLLSYLQLPSEPWLLALRAAVGALAPGGRVIIVLHARRNLTEGYGGPSDVAVLHDPDDVVAAASDLPVAVESSELRTRLVATDDGERRALDTVVVLRAVS